MRYKLVIFLFFMILFLGSTGLASAASPDSGLILRQQEQLNTQLQPVKPSAKIETAPELSVSSNIRVVIKKFKFTGYRPLVTLRELTKITSSYIGKKVSFADLQHLTQMITEYLREKKGYLLARAYLPQQDITAGVITIAIIPGRLDGKVHVLINGTHRISEPFLEKIADGAIPQDGTILRRDVERAVLLMNDLPGVSARAYLDKGTVPGTTRVSLLSREGGWVAATLSADNFGDRYTGTLRRIGQVAFIDSLHRGDLLQLTYINSDHLNQGRVGFSIPVGPRGALFNIAYNGLRYQLGGKLKDLEAKGTAQTLSSDIRYPLKRTRNASIWVGTGLDYYLLRDKAAGTVTSDRDVTTGNLSLAGDFYDGFFHGGLTSFLATVYAGDVEITDGNTSDAAGARTDGAFSRVTYALARLQRETRNLSLFLSARGQFADSNLDSSQKIILGGPTGVRAYPIGEAAGDQGNIMTAEERLDLPFTPPAFRTQLVGFADTGEVWLNKNPWTNAVTNITGRNHYWISGAGVGVTVGKSGVYRVQLSYAHKLGNNPGRDTLGNDSNNRHDGGRFWLQATVWF